MDKKKIKKNFVDQGLAAKSTKQGKATSALFNANSSINTPKLNNQFCKQEDYFDFGQRAAQIEIEIKQAKLAHAGSLLYGEEYLIDFPSTPLYDPQTGLKIDYYSEIKAKQEAYEYAKKRYIGTATKAAINE